MEESRVEAPIGSIQVFRGGSGPPLVYFHSAGGESALPVLDDLAHDFEVIVPVFPGFGESEGIDDIDGMEDAVFHLLDMWELLGLEAPSPLVDATSGVSSGGDRPRRSSPAILGLSLGGWLALELATRYPEKVGAMVLVNPVGLHIDGEPIAEMFGRTPAELAEMLFVDQDHPIAQVMHAMAEFSGDVGKQMEIPLEVIVPMVSALAATARLGWDPYLHNPKLRSRLRRITAPTLIVAGAQDGLVPAVYAETFADEIPGAKLDVVEGAAHWLPLEKPDELAALVRGFLA